MQRLCDKPESLLDFLCVFSHFMSMARFAMEQDMSHDLTHHLKPFGLLHRDEAGLELGGYRFGRRREIHGRGRSALHRASSYLKALVQSIADAKIRRMLRELELKRGCLEMRDELWVPDALRDRGTTK
jgi:hypothetical protein